jgi:hypothetical protein
MFLLMIATIKNPDAVAKLLGVVINLWKRSMEKIIGQTLFESKPAPFIRVRCAETTTGHVEFSAFRPKIWHEVCEVVS